MRLRLVPMVLAVLALAACGGHSKRAAITDYITRVNDVQSGMATDLRAVTNANRQFAKSQTDPKTVRDVAQSERTLRRLRQRLALVLAPPEAKHLRSLMLQLVDAEISLAHEVYALAVFVPRYGTTLAPLQPASATLKRELALTAKGTAATKQLNAAKADALTTYAGQVADVLFAMASLDPPDVWLPTYTQQRASLAQLRSAALSLAQAIHANDAKAIPHLLEAFDAAAVSNQSLAAQKRERAAVVAYNARIRAIVRLVTRIQNERGSLQKKYG